MSTDNEIRNILKRGAPFKIRNWIIGGTFHQIKHTEACSLLVNRLEYEQERSHLFCKGAKDEKEALERATDKYIERIAVLEDGIKELLTLDDPDHDSDRALTVFYRMKLLEKLGNKMIETVDSIRGILREGDAKKALTKLETFLKIFTIVPLKKPESEGSACPK